MEMTCPKSKNAFHKFQIGEKKFVIDIKSISSFAIDDIVWDILGLCDSPSNDVLIKRLSKKYPEEDIIDALDQMEELEQKGLLFGEDKHKDHTPPKEEESSLLALCLNVAGTCNLQCKYCFVEYHKTVGKMNKETAKNAVDFLITKSCDAKNLSISFFGGEPLINFDLIKFVVKYAKELEREFGKKFSFGITTNGTLLNKAVQDFLNHHNFSAIISLDGPPEINDKYRIFPDGAGSYDIVVPQVSRFVQSRSGKGVTIRSTFTHETLYPYDIVRHLADDLEFPSISVEPGYTSRDSKTYITEADVSIIKNEFGKLALWYLDRIKEGKSFDFFYFRKLINQLNKGETHITQCGAGHHYLSVSASGDIHACHWFTGMDKYKMGNVNAGEYDLAAEEEFASIWVGAKNKCEMCWAKYVCGGGCFAHAVFYKDDPLEIHEIFCEFFKHIIELSVMLYDALIDNNLLESYLLPQKQIVNASNLEGNV